MAYAPHVCGLIVLAGTWLAIAGLWLRQRAAEVHAFEREAQTAAQMLRRYRRLLARVAAIEIEHRRARLVAQVLADYGPSRGDAE